MKIRIVLGIAAMLTLAVGIAGAGELGWEIDKDHTRVGFSVTHLGINTVRGAFQKFDATVRADDAGKLTSVAADVAVSSVDTGNEKRDTHLRAAEVFDAAKYPKMRLVTKKIAWKGKRFFGTADLTIKGTTRTVKFTGKLTGVKTVTMNGKTTVRAGYTVQAAVNRKQFGIGFGGFSEGLGMVGESVKIDLDVELFRDQ